MKRVTKKKWLKALRSGEYKQGSSHLRCGNNYCCLGVLCDITGNSKNRPMGEPWPIGYDEPFMGLTPHMQHNLANLNDRGVSFEEIAAYISRNVKTED